MRRVSFRSDPWEGENKASIHTVSSSDLGKMNKPGRNQSIRKINSLPPNEMKLIKNHNMSTTLLTLFKSHNTTLLTIDSMLYERSLELIFFKGHKEFLEVLDIFIILIVVIKFSQVYTYAQVHKIYTLNICSFIYQLYLNRACKTKE